MISSSKQGDTYVSPSDAIMSPASQKLQGFKQRQINKQRFVHIIFHPETLTTSYGSSGGVFFFFLSIFSFKSDMKRNQEVLTRLSLAFFLAAARIKPPDSSSRERRAGMKAVQTSTLLLSRNGLEKQTATAVLREKEGNEGFWSRTWILLPIEKKKRKKKLLSADFTDGFLLSWLYGQGRPFQQEKNGKSSGYTPFSSQRRFGRRN